MQIKTTMRYHLTPVKIAIINKLTNNTCWTGCGKGVEKGESLCTLGNAVWCTTVESSMEIPQKIKNGSAF